MEGVTESVMDTPLPVLTCMDYMDSDVCHGREACTAGIKQALGMHSNRKHSHIVCAHHLQKQVAAAAVS